jgi:transcriptional regulator with XRE-family HTH domain
MKNQEVRERFVELRAQGWSFERIAKELNCSKQTLINWSKESSLQIRNLKALHLDALQDKYLVGKEHRVRVFGEQLNRMIAELEKRDYRHVPTMKLLEMVMKYSTALHAESGPLIFREKVGFNLSGLEEDEDSWTA